MKLKRGSRGRHGGQPRAEYRVPTGHAISTGKYGRLFPSLDPLEVEEGHLRELAGAMLESAAGIPSGAAGDNPNIPSAYIFFGQFMDHDITFDATTAEETRVDPYSLVNYRTPRFDLDSLYGAGPAVQPHLYERERPDYFEIGGVEVNKFENGAMVPDTGLRADLPRGRNRFALIGDARNDENAIVAQLHLAFLYFHNRMREALEDNTIPRQAPLRKTPFEEARDLVIRHYQWVILYDFLPRIVGEDLVRDLLKTETIMARTNRVFMPVEFSAAAFRFGHSALRPVYNINEGTQASTLIGLLNFSGRAGSAARVPITENWIVEWYRLLHMEPYDNVMSRRIDPYLADELAKLPLLAGATQSLPETNLLRGNMLGLPSGQSVARLLNCNVLKPEEIASSGPDGEIAKKYSMDIDSPLWYYVLKEAQLREGGQRLGPMGARVVAEVIIGLLQLDERSILNRARRWKPFAGSEPGEFTFVDLLRFAGVMNQSGPGIGPGPMQTYGSPISDSCYNSYPATP